MESMHRFPHEALDAFPAVQAYLAALEQVLRGFPRGAASLASQLRRAGESILLNLCEGAARTAPADKAHLYDIGAASGAESAGALALAGLRRLGTVAARAQAEARLRRAVSLVTGLARSARRRGGRGTG